METKSPVFTPILIGGSIILMISFAIRSSFGLFQIPIADEFLWPRAEFSMAIAIQNLAWGVATPFFGALAEKFGDRKAISFGIVLYTVGLLISSNAVTQEAHQFLNLIIGCGIAGSGFGPILAVVGRSTSPERRSLVLGITTAAGSAGQVIGPPFTSALLNSMSWSTVMMVLAIIVFATLLCLLAINPSKTNIDTGPKEKLGDALVNAAGVFLVAFNLASSLRIFLLL